MEWAAVGALLLWALAWGAEGPGGGPLKVRLRERATVASPTVRLGDIADLEGEAQGSPWAQLEVASAPWPSRRRVLIAGQVATRLAQAGLREREFLLEGAKQVVVERGGRPLAPSELEEALAKALRQPLRLLLPPPPLWLPEGPLRVEAPLPNSPRALLPVRVFVEEDLVATIKVLVSLSSEGKSPSSLPLHPSPLLVRPREEVLLRARCGQVVVEGKGTALQGGRQGEEVLVRLPWSPKPLKGTVTGEGEVTLWP